MFKGVILTGCLKRCYHEEGRLPLKAVRCSLQLSRSLEDNRADKTIQIVVGIMCFGVTSFEAHLCNSLDGTCLKYLNAP